LTWAAFLVATLALATSPHATALEGQVVDEAGNGVTGVTVFAIDWRTGRIAARVPSQAGGAFVLTLPRRRRHLLQAEGPGWTLLRLEKLGQRHVRLVVRPQPQATGGGRAPLAIQRTAAARTGPALEVVSGRVMDETRSGLGGVRLSLIDAHGRTVAAASSDAAGGFRASAPPGDHTLLLFAPGLRLHRLEASGPNQWQIILAVEAATETVYVQQEPPADPDNPVARERARLAFEGRPVSSQPRVSPTLADLHASRGTVSAGGAHAVARQPVGGFCLVTSHCRQSNGPAVCCASDGQLVDEYIWAGGRQGVCKPAKACAGAQKFRRLVSAP